MNIENADTFGNYMIHGIDEIAGRGKRWRRMPYHSLTDDQLAELEAFLKRHQMI